MRKLILASLTISSTLAAQAPGGPPRTTPLRGSLERGLAQPTGLPPVERGTRGPYRVGPPGRGLHHPNAAPPTRPASTTKLVAHRARTGAPAREYRGNTS